MSFREIILEDVECHISLLEEAVSCLLHTILFLRNPKKVTPEDCSCQLLAPLTYAKCGQQNCSTDVQKAIEMLNITMTNIGPKLSRGVITLCYLQRREKSAFFGFTTMSEKVYFEKWRVAFVVNHSPFRPSRDEAGELERERARDSCRNQLQLRMLHIFQAVSQDVECLPAEYEHEIDVSSGGSNGNSGSAKHPSVVQYNSSGTNDGNQGQRSRSSSASNIPVPSPAGNIRY